MGDPLEIECRACGAKPGEKCSEPQFGVFKFTFHNIRMRDNMERLLTPAPFPAPPEANQ